MRRNVRLFLSIVLLLSLLRASPAEAEPPEPEPPADALRLTASAVLGLRVDTPSPGKSSRLPLAGVGLGLDGFVPGRLFGAVVRWDLLPRPMAGASRDLLEHQGRIHLALRLPVQRRPWRLVFVPSVGWDLRTWIVSASRRIDVHGLGLGIALRAHVGAIGVELGGGLTLLPANDVSIRDGRAAAAITVAGGPLMFRVELSLRHGALEQLEREPVEMYATDLALRLGAGCRF
jgi:hypothetical protein